MYCTLSPTTNLYLWFKLWIFFSKFECRSSGRTQKVAQLWFPIIKEMESSSGECHNDLSFSKVETEISARARFVWGVWRRSGVGWLFAGFLHAPLPQAAVHRRWGENFLNFLPVQDGGSLTRGRTIKASRQVGFIPLPEGGQREEIDSNRRRNARGGRKEEETGGESGGRKWEEEERERRDLELSLSPKPWN